MVFTVSDGSNAYVQVALPEKEGDHEAYGEAVSNAYLEPPYQLTGDQIAALMNRGWNLPIPHDQPRPAELTDQTIMRVNFWRVWPVHGASDLNGIASTCSAP